MTEVICTVKDLRKSFFKQGKEIPVIREVNLSVARGDMCSIRGKSGVGKSTLLHILGTLDRPTSGDVSFLGRDIFAEPEEDLAAFRNQSIGFVFQFHHLLPEFTAVENVAMPALVGGQHRREAVDLASKLLEDVGLSDRMDHRPGELSGGEQQRVAIARALVMSPALVLADEPTGNLDRSTSNAIHELILRINETRGVAFMIVTHNSHLADMMPRQLEMRDGVVYEGGQ